MTALPSTRFEVIQRYGNPGRGVADPRWVRSSLVTCHPRGDRPTMPGVPERFYFMCHRDVEVSLRAAFAAAQAASSYRIQRAGGWVFRHARHDASRPLSLHAWGIAVDIDAAANKAREFRPGTRPEPWSPEWMRIWPEGLPREFVAAFEDAGWRWGGRWTGYCDPMHFQLAEATA